MGSVIVILGLCGHIQMGAKFKDALCVKESWVVNINSQQFSTMPPIALVLLGSIKPNQTVNQLINVNIWKVAPVCCICLCCALCIRAVMHAFQERRMVLQYWKVLGRVRCC